MPVEQPKSGKGGSRSAAATPYTSRIIKAGALLGDTTPLLAHWDESQSVGGNLDRIRRENLFGKASRSRVEDILAIFRQRYLVDESVTKALVILTKGGFPAAALDRILYFYAASADPLLHDAVTEILLPMHSRAKTDVGVADVEKAVVQWVNAGKTTTKWSDITIRRATQELLAALRDFGVLQGAAHKRIAPAYLPIAAFAYVAFCLKQRQASAARLLELPDWSLFFLPPAGVERLLIEAQQHGLLEYHVAGAVSRLTFPAQTIEEYANVIAQRPH